MTKEEQYLEDLLTVDEVICILETIKSKHGENIRVGAVNYKNFNDPTVDIDYVEPQVIKTSVTGDNLIVVIN